MTVNTRSALILFSETIVDSKKITHVLLGNGSNGLTTIGGRKKLGENDVGCLIREISEETRNLLDYSKIPEFFNSKSCNKISFSNCLYVFIQDTYSSLKNISEKYKTTESSTEEGNELKSLDLIDVDDLICDLIIEKTRFIYNDTFKTMFLNVGYDKLKKIEWNRQSRKIGVQVDLKESYSAIPEYISLHINDRFLTRIYGKILSNGLLISDQYYGFVRGKHLFRV